MSIDFTLRFLRVVVIREARNGKGVPQLGGTKKGTVRVKVSVASS